MCHNSVSDHVSPQIWLFTLQNTRTCCSSPFSRWRCCSRCIAWDLRWESNFPTTTLIFFCFSSHCKTFKIIHILSHHVGLLRIAFQSFRLFRRHRLNQWNDINQLENYATSRYFGTALCETAQSLQSHKVSNELQRVIRNKIRTCLFILNTDNHELSFPSVLSVQQVLAKTLEPGSFTAQFDTIDRLALVAALSLHRHLRPFGNASVRW